MLVLNDEQKIASEAINGCFVVVSCPGSGKSSVVLNRHLKMLASGIPSKDILNLTFTNAAAKELVRRIGLLDADSVFKTFHSFCIDLLKKEKEHLPFKLCDTVIPVGMEDFKLLFDLVKAYPAIANWRELQDRISNWKNRNVSPEQAIAESTGMDTYYAKAFLEYEETCRQDGWLDFDDCILETVKLLESNLEVRQRHQRKYIAVDECQDTSLVQFRLLQLLFAGNILCVGDEGQLIFSWRNAQEGNLTNLARVFPGTKTLYLTRNFRSTKRLVEFFRAIIPVDNGLASTMNSENEEGSYPTITKYADDTEEAERVLTRITDPEHTAIIARTNRQLFIFQRLCLTRQIKYKILGKKDFFEQNEIKKLLKLAEESRDMRNADVVLTDTIKKHNLANLYKYSAKPLESNPIENMNNLVKMASGKGNIHSFLAYLVRLTKARKSSKGLTLSTAHQTKGMEFDNVFVVGVNQDKMPHKDGELAEERRVFYVAATRAAKTLNFSYYGTRSMFLSTPEVLELLED